MRGPEGLSVWVGSCVHVKGEGHAWGGLFKITLAKSPKNHAR